MLDDQQDKEMMRNQIIAIVLMTLLAIVWINFYAPKRLTPSSEPAPVAAGQQSEQVADSDAVAVADLGAAESTNPDEWPHLPPVAVPEEGIDDEVSIENEHLRLVFTRVGARLKEAYVLLGASGGDSVQLVPAPPEELADVDVVYPMGLRFTENKIGEALNKRRFDANVASSGKAVTFSVTLPGVAVIRKTFRLDERPYVVDMDVAYENLEGSSRVLGMDQTPAMYLEWGPNVASGDEQKGVKQGIYWFKDGALDSVLTSKMGGGGDTQVELSRSIPGAEWIAIKSAYFVVAFRPVQEGARVLARGGKEQFYMGASVPRFDVAPGAVHTAAFEAYVGPSQLETLTTAWDSLPKVQRFFKSVDAMDWFAKMLLRLLNWFYGFIPNYGLAIIFLTVLVRLVMYPLTLKSTRSMKKMQMLAPELEEIKKKYGDDQQEMNKRMMELYKERGVNPMGGCFPILLQMPIFIGLYRMLLSAFELRGAPFVFWITDLSEPDQLFHIEALATVPFLGMFEYVNLLPVLGAAVMLVSQKMMPTSGPAQNPQQKFMMTFMPVFFAFILYKMPSGTNLYILTSTVLGIVQQQLTRVSDVNEQPKKKVRRKPQHFYTAAVARKRQIARESKRQRKGKGPGKNRP